MATLGSSLTALSADGKTTVDDKLVFEESTYSYKSVKQMCGQIIKDLDPWLTGKQTVVIADLAFLSDLANLRAASLTLSDLSSSFQGLFQQGGGALDHRMAARPELKESYAASFASASMSLAGASSVVAPLLETALGVVGLFREDVDYKGGSPTVDPLAFAIEFASCIKQQRSADITVFIPAFIALPLSSSSDGLTRLLAEVQGKRAAAWTVISPLISDLANVEARLEAAVLAKDQPVIEEVSIELRELSAHMQPLTSVFGRADQRFTDMRTQWAQVDPKSGLTSLARMIRAEAIQAIGPTYLHAEVIASGGYTRSAKGFFTNLFGGDGLSTSGGAVIRWALLDRSGALIAGDVVSSSLSGLP